MHTEPYSCPPRRRPPSSGRVGGAARGRRGHDHGAGAGDLFGSPGGELQGRTSLFIVPGHRFRAVDAMVTNFHLPRSTLLALVMAFAGIEQTRDLYRTAVAERYRFYSFGDAMLIQ